jgi:hypothetical protein
METKNEQNLLLEMQEAAIVIGHVEWGATDKLDAQSHADHVKQSIENTADFFGQTELQAMHGLYIKNKETVICHTGTSPNSSMHARILTALWNRFVDEAIQQRNYGQ